MYSRHLHADLETPVSAYLKLRGTNRWSFLYESVEGSEHWANYSILGAGARRIFQVRDQRVAVTDETGSSTFLSAQDPLTGLRQAMAYGSSTTPLEPDLPRFVGGSFGFLSYDAVRHFEKLPGVGGTPEVPDALFFEPEVVAVFDNRRHSLTLYARDEILLDEAIQRMRGPLGPTIPSRGWSEPKVMDPPARYQEAVRTAKEHIRAGDIIQVVLSRRFELEAIADPFDVYRGLRTINPSPYLFYFQSPDVSLAGASPEVMVRVEEGRMTVRPIAGTRPRGATPQEDRALAQELTKDPKECAEHIMLVDLGRNDIGRVCQVGSVEIPDLMVVERYSHVMHIVSEVQGTLSPTHDAFDALRASFPAGTLSGAPKVRAMQIIDNLEGRRRGVYGGAVGYFGPRGDADFGIAIRTLVAYPDRFVVQAGAGIVVDSDPQKECEETEHKARAVLRAAKWAAEGSGVN